jgi:hypothetical protein
MAEDHEIEVTEVRERLERVAQRDVGLSLERDLIGVVVPTLRVVLAIIGEKQDAGLHKEEVM